MAAARNAYTEIDHEIGELGNALNTYDRSRVNFIRELRVLFDAWVDILVDCPAENRESLAEQLDISPDQLDDIIGKLRRINQRIVTNQDFRAEQHAIMRFINLYQDILAKIPRVAKPALSAEEEQYARDQGPSTASERLSQLGIIRAPPAAPSGGVDPEGLFSRPGAGWSSSLAAAPTSGSAPNLGARAAAEDVPPSAQFPPTGLHVDKNGTPLNVGDTVKTKNGNNGTIKDIRVNPDSNVVSLRVDIVRDGVTTSNWVLAASVTKEPSGGKSRRFKKTKRRRQQKTRKYKK
jgi:hypothetical protein